MIYDIANPSSIWDFINSGGIIGLLAVIVIGGIKKWYVFGWQYKAVEESNAKWMELALRSTNLAESIDTLRKERPL